MKKLFNIITLLLSLIAFSQENENKKADETEIKSDDKTVTLTVSGSGKTLEEAKTNALRSAIEQVYGAFISYETDIFNDNLVIISLSNSNIQKYEIVSQVEIPNNGYVITLSTTISITKLASFAQSKGVAVEFNGGMFAMKMKLLKLNEESELRIIKNLCKTSFEILLNSVDYTLTNTEPSLIGKNVFSYKFDFKNGLYSREYEKDDYKIGFNVNVKSNKNLLIFQENFKKVISSLSMNENEIENYKNLNKQIVEIIIDSNKYYLRNYSSAEIINTFFIKVNLIPSFFEINSNVENFNYILTNRNEDKLDEEREKNITFLDAYNEWIDNDDSYWHGRNYSLASNTIASCTNLYPFYADISMSYKDILKAKETHIYSCCQENDNRLQFSEHITLNNVEFSKTFNFFRYFSLAEIEKIGKFEIKKIDLLNDLKKEENRQKNIQFIIFESNGNRKIKNVFELNGKEYECINCDYRLNTFEKHNDYYAQLIDKNQDFYIIKSIHENNLLPGKLFKLKPAKEMNIKISNELIDVFDKAVLKF